MEHLIPVKGQLGFLMKKGLQVQYPMGKGYKQKSFQEMNFRFTNAASSIKVDTKVCQL